MITLFFSNKLYIILLECLVLLLSKIFNSLLIGPEADCDIDLNS